MHLVCRLLLEKKNFFNDTATTEIYTLSLHDALPIYLMLYRMNDDTEYAYGDTVNLTHSESPEADEPFIGEFIGYLHGTPLLDENGEPFIGDIPEEDLQELIWQAVWGGLPSETIKEYTAFGFTGEELDISNAIDAPEPTETPTEPKPTETPTEPEPTERSEEHTSELQSPDCISYAVFCLKKIFF